MIKLKVVIEIDYDNYKTLSQRELMSEKEDFELDDILQTLCYALPTHDIARGKDISVIQAFDKDQKLIGHGEM